MKSYSDKVHTWGRIWSVSALCALLSVPLLICVHMDVWPPMSGILKGLASVIPLYWTTSIAEVISYSPMLGAGGMYLSFVTGNIANLKLPCALSAMETAKVRPNTEEGEVITTISIASSSIATTLIITAGVLIFTPILPKITAPGSVFAPAFQQILPALFGAIGAGYFIKHWKISIVPIAAGILTLCFLPSLAVGPLIFVTVVSSLLGAHIMFKTKIV
ncbi:MAG: hypothetical protein FWF05_01345 [Oscillospiraceae bacterium]|nr:hypothetical protein [Oscillospiraceae bacterium]